MRYEIDGKIIKQADKCHRNHACLAEDQEPHSRVAVLMRGQGDEIPLLDCPAEVDCHYYQSFETSCICLCPVRKAIYKQYGD